MPTLGLRTITIMLCSMLRVLKIKGHHDGLSTPNYSLSMVCCEPGPPIFMSKIRGPGVEATISIQKDQRAWGGGYNFNSKRSEGLGWRLQFQLKKIRGPGVIASFPGPTNFSRVGPGWRNFNGNHNSGCLHGDAFFHHDIIPECPWPSRVGWWKYSEWRHLR